MFLINLAGTELIAGDAEGARRTAGRVRDHVEPLLRERPILRYPWNYKITALLIEAYLNLRAGRVSEASRVAELAAVAFQTLKAPLSNQEHSSRMYRGIVLRDGKTIGCRSPGRIRWASASRRACHLRDLGGAPDALPRSGRHGNRQWPSRRPARAATPNNRTRSSLKTRSNPSRERT